jgi:signal transduction histidine kinase
VSEKERLLQLLHQNEKLAGMGRVIAGIAHEIRNPLGIICSSAQFLLGRAKETDPAGANILRAIYDEGRRLSQTVTDFLDYARPKIPRQDPVDVLAVLEQSLSFLGPELSANKVQLNKTYLTEDGGPTPGAFMLAGDKDLLYRAFYNVLINAVQAVKERPERRISLEVRPAAEDDIAGGSRRDFVLVAVADNGPGFGDEDLSRFLDPFYTTKPLGSGLGLPIVSSIIASHGGVLEIANRRRQGSDAENPAPDGQKIVGAVVRIILPLAR